MGTFRCPLRISSMDGQQERDVEATVDTGAAYTTLPGSLLRELGIEPMDKGVFLLADGRRVEMDIGRAWATVNGSSEVTLVVFGEDDAPASVGSLHPGRVEAGGGPHCAATRSHPSHHVLERATLAAHLPPAPDRLHPPLTLHADPLPRRRPPRLLLGATLSPAPPCRSGWRRGPGCAGPSGRPCDVPACRTALERSRASSSSCSPGLFRPLFLLGSFMVRGRSGESVGPLASRCRLCGRGGRRRRRKGRAPAASKPVQAPPYRRCAPCARRGRLSSSPPRRGSSGCPRAG